jgi:AcrR family transcriptional regulator
MRAFLHALLRSFHSASRALAALSGEIASNAELNRAWSHTLAGQLSACVRALVERALARGEMPPDSDVDLLSILPLAILQYRWLEHSQERDDVLVDRIVRQFFLPYGPPGVSPHAPAP